MPENPTPLSREFLLTAASCIWPPSERRAQAIRHAASGPVDWPRVYRLAARHRVFGLVHNGLSRAGLPLPPDLAADLAARAGAQAQSGLAAAAEAAALNEAFIRAGVPVIFIKGATLAQLAYDNLGIRHAKDIDIVVAQDRVPAACDVLAQAGYRQNDPSPALGASALRVLTEMRKDFSFVNDRKKQEIELHWRLFYNPLLLPGLQRSARLHAVPLAGSSLMTFDDETLFIYLCVHGAEHAWFRLKWLADIGALLARTEDGAQRLYDAAVARGAGAATGQALLLCRRLLGSPLPASLLVALTGDRAARRLERTALWAMTVGSEELVPNDVLFGSARINLANLRLGSGWRYRLTQLNINLTAPADVAALPLPAGLRFLYPVLRLPLWLWRRVLRKRR